MPLRTLTRFELFKLATLFQGGILVAGLIIAWLVGINLAEVWTWSSESIVRGVLATIPMLIVFGITELFDWDPFRRIQKFLHETLGPVIVRCTIWELLYLAFLAGISEEILFRGAIQNALVLWSLLGGVVIANLLFGICHAFSPAYFFLATAAGFYLSWVAGWSEQNLLPAVVAHTLYDLIALILIRWEVSRERQGSDETGTDLDEDPPVHDQPDSLPAIVELPASEGEVPFPLDFSPENGQNSEGR